MSQTLSAGITRDRAFELLNEHNKDPFHITHGETVEGTMRYFAREFDPENEEFWGIVGLLHDFGNEVSGFARIDERALASFPNGSCTVVGEPVEGLQRNDLAHEHQRALLVPVVSCRLPDEVVFADVVVVEPSGEAGGIGVPSFTVSRDDDVRYGLADVMQKTCQPTAEKPAF